ncbi:transporter [Prevotella herbatica]|uniref:Transporter n=1 Tax=Prevotella herbatica TaxID=2801997 RepID=A0ABM7NX98_9BACT|nr:TolC family protein [Prevotella herbatica]BCS85149.1 transporter [Prevotella herbatica]
MIKRFILTITLVVILSVNANSQIVRKMSISDMFQLAESNSRELNSQRTGLEVANEGVKVAKSERLPDVNVKLNANYMGNILLTDRDFTNVHGYSAFHFGNEFAVDAQQVVYAGGAINANIKLAQLGKEQAGLGLDMSRENIRFIALGEYLDLQKLQNREKVIEDNVELTAKLIANIEEKHNQGVALKNDITRYELQMQTLRLTLTKIRNQRSIINHQLCNSLGLVNSEIIQPTDDTASAIFSKDGETKWQTETADQSQQIKISRLNERIAEQQIKIAKSDFMPKVSLVACNDFNGPITFEILSINKNLNAWYVGVGVKYSLSSIFKSNKKLSKAKLAFKNAKEQTDVVGEQLNNQVQAAYTQYLESYTELETQEKDVELAQQNYKVINERYINQLALITDMLDASNMKLDAELSEVDARINIAYAYYKMKYIAGQL